MIDKRSDENQQTGDFPKISNYKLLEEMGKRGSSTVYTAAQETAGQRKAVVRLFRTGKERKEVPAAFNNLKKAAAVMPQENVAQVYDAGFTESGSNPYFVTEFVTALPITEFCDKYRLTIDERLELLLNVCQIIQQAHFKGLVHLSLRPSTIRVSQEQEKSKPVVKILDFGVAKAFSSQDLAADAVHTGCEADVPAYLSPEQIGNTEGDADIRSDVYSLGILLYELLTGTTPFSKTKNQNEPFTELCQRIRLDPPLPLAEACSSHGEENEKIARMRKTTPVELEKEYRGDLSWIIKKALTKQRENRYDSVSALATDIARYRKKQTVLAHPSSIIYTARKFIAGNRAAVIVFAILVLVGIFFYLRNISIAVAAEAARKEAEHFKMQADFNTAAALKEKALSCARENRWSMARLFTVHSLLYQARAGKYLNLGDIALPYSFQGWQLKYSHAGFSPLFSLSRDGRYLASGDKEGMIKIWQTTDGKEVRVLPGNNSKMTGLETIHSVSFSPDGKTLAAGGKKMVKAWDIAAGKEKLSFSPVGEKQEILSISYSPDGEYLVVCGTDEITTWKTSGELSAALKGSAEFTGQVSFSPDSKYLTTWDQTGTVRVRQLANLEEFKVLQGDGEAVYSTCFTPDGKYLAAGKKGSILAWDLSSDAVVLRASMGSGKNTGTDIYTDVNTDTSDTDADLGTYTDTEPAAVSTICFSEDGKYLAAGSEAGSVKIWELGPPGEKPDFNYVQETSLLKTGSTYAARLRFFSGGHCLAAGCADKIIRVWEVYKTQPALHQPNKAGSTKNQLTTAPRPKKVIFLPLCSGYGRSLDYSPDGKYLAAAGERSAKTWNLGSAAVSGTGVGKGAAELNTINWGDIETPIAMLSFSPDSRYLAIVGGNNVKIWDAAAGKEIITMKGGLKGVQSVDFDPKGKYLAASGELAIKIWEISSGEAVSVFQANIEGVGPVKFSPDGRYLASGDIQGVVKIRDLTTLEIVLTRNEHDGMITALCFSPDGKYLASAAALDKAVKISEILSPEVYRDLKGHRSEVVSLAFSPNGKYLVSGSKTGTLKVWDTVRGMEIASMRGSGAPAAALDFNNSGEFLAVGYGKTVQIWDFYYYVHYLHFDLGYPYEPAEVEKIVKTVEQETGFVLQGITPAVPMDAYAYYNRGENYLSRKEYNKATAAYRKSLELEPRSAAAWYELGAALRHQGNFSEAESALQKSIELKAGSADTWYELGNAYLQDKKYDLSIDAFQKALKIKPNVPRFLHDLGLAFDRKGDDAKAIVSFNQAIAAAPRYAPPRYRLGLVYDRTGELDKAIGAFEGALVLTPGDKATWNHLGITLHKKQEYERSIQAFQRAVEIDPEFAGAWNNMGITYRDQGNYEKAVQLHNRAIEVNPAYDLGWDALGNTYNVMKDYKNAITAYKRSIEINPMAWSSYGNLGFIYVKREQPEKAIEAFEKTVEINNSFFPAWNSLGALYARKGNYQKSVDAYRQAVTLKPREHEVRNNLGKSYYLKGDYDDAMAQFEEAVKIENRNYSAHFNIALTHLAQKRFESAHSYYIKVMEQLKPEKSYISAAIADIDKLLQKNPDYNFAYLVRRYLYNQAGDKAKAREDLERFINFIKSSKGNNRP